MADARIAPFARNQHGLVTTAQVLSVRSAWQLEWLVSTRRLEPVRRGVYRVAGTPDRWLQRLLAACLARPGACASFRAAAALWEMPSFTPDRLEITVPGARRARLDGVTVHQSQVWAPGHVAASLGIPVTSVARTLCDLTAVASKSAVERAVDDALRRKLVTLRSLTRVADLLDQPGRRRSTAMRAVLAARTEGYEPGESAPEARIARLLARAGLPKPKHQHPVRLGGRTIRIDLAYPAAMLAIEYDGWDFHSQRGAFDADRARANELEVLGWTVLRFTSRSTNAEIVALVTAALARASVT